MKEGLWDGARIRGEAFGVRCWFLWCRVPRCDARHDNRHLVLCSEQPSNCGELYEAQSFCRLATGMPRLPSSVPCANGVVRHPVSVASRGAFAPASPRQHAAAAGFCEATGAENARRVERSIKLSPAAALLRMKFPRDCAQDRRLHVEFETLVVRDRGAEISKDSLDDFRRGCERR